MSNIDNTVVITAETGFNEHRLKNFYFTNVFQGFTWMLFHFAVVFFFTQLLNNLALVGIFLGFANLAAFVLDIPLGILQRYISTKKFFFIGSVSQLVAIGIFLVMIFNAFHIVQTMSEGVINLFSEQRNVITSAISTAFSANILNWIGLFIAAMCYGLTKEINEVSTFGYILSNASPKEYGIILSRSNITFGIGSLLGLVLSGFLLNQLPSVLTLMILGGLIVGFMTFTIRFFDNSIESLSMSDIKEFTVSIKKLGEGNVKEKLSQKINAIDLQKVISSTKYLFLKPKQQNTGKKIPWKEVFTATKKEFVIIWGIISHTPTHYVLVWGLILVLIFGFWDTFASSFLVDYLDDIKHGWGYILLAAIGIPGIVLQEFAIKLGQKFWDRTIGVIGLALSAGSLIVMGILAIGEPPSAMVIIDVALINSLGYACGMAIGQNVFLETYNKIYAAHENLTEIDANASAGPMKVIQNLANVVGLMLGWILLMLGFAFFFFVFALLVGGTLFWTITKKKEITV